MPRFFSAPFLTGSALLGILLLPLPSQTAPMPNPISGADDIFVSQGFSGGKGTITEYTPSGDYVRTLQVPANTGSSAPNGTEYLRGIAVTDAGQIVGFNGTFSPQLTTYHPGTRTFTSRAASPWLIYNNVSSGSLGVTQGYTFALSDNPATLLRFSPDGSVQRFWAVTDYRQYVNLAVGGDGKLYVLYNTGGSYSVDIYNPANLQLLRTVPLQVPSAHGSESTDLRNLAVDTSGTIYAIELYNYVYHLDANGVLLQSASHGQGGYTEDIKIDPVSGRILIDVGVTSSTILQTDATLSSFSPLIQFDSSNSLTSFIAFGNAKLAAALNATAHVLWSNTNGAISVWNYSRDAGSFGFNNYGPYPGWTVKAVADNPDSSADGQTRLLWNNADGQASIWSLDNGSGEYTHHEFGPYPGWTATSLSVAADNTTHLLWNSTDGAASVWNYQTVDGSFTFHNYGPYPGWSAKAIADGTGSLADGSGLLTRLLWTKTDQTMSLWGLNSAAGTFASSSYGPYTGWSANALSVSADNTTHILWNSSDGRASVWNQQADEFGSFTQNTFGPYTGWSAKAIADGTDGRTSLLWNKTDGTMSLWDLDNSSGLFSQFSFGPYSGWTALGVSSTL